LVSLIVTKKNIQVIAYIGNKVLCLRHGSLYTADVDLTNIEFVCSIKLSILQGIFIRIRLLCRLFRASVRCAEVLDDRYVFFVYFNKIYCFDFFEKSVSIDFNFSPSMSCLNLTDVSNISNDYSLIFGDYFNNPDMSPVSLWVRKKSDLSWMQLVTFESGLLNHIHNIIITPDYGLLILAGDFGRASSIYTLSDFDSSPILLHSNSQLYRSCGGFFLAEMFFYSTDTQLSQNYFCCLKEDAEILQPINGPAIYYGSGFNSDFFCTAVEPDKPSSSFFYDLFSTTHGPGINSPRSCIYEFKDGVISEIFSLSKDYLPYRLFQFGSFMFPAGSSPDSSFLVYCQALEGYDGCTLLLGKK